MDLHTFVSAECPRWTDGPCLSVFVMRQCVVYRRNNEFIIYNLGRVNVCVSNVSLWMRIAYSRLFPSRFFTHTQTNWTFLWKCLDIGHHVCGSTTWEVVLLFNDLVVVQHFFSSFFFRHSHNFLSSNQGCVYEHHDWRRCGRRKDGEQAGRPESNAYKMINGRDILEDLSNLFRFLAQSFGLLFIHPSTAHSIQHTLTHISLGVSEHIYTCVSLQYIITVVVADRPLMKYKWSVFGLSIWSQQQSPSLKMDSMPDHSQTQKKTAIRKYFIRRPSARPPHRPPYSKNKQTNTVRYGIVVTTND